MLEKKMRQRSRKRKSLLQRVNFKPSRVDIHSFLSVIVWLSSVDTPNRRVLRIGDVGLQPTVSSLARVPRAMP